jgi:cytochrome c2
MGYHETITVFWLRLVAAFAARAEVGPSLAEVANRLIVECDNKELIYDYYSRELIESAKAKAEWVEPDLRKLESPS